MGNICCMQESPPSRYLPQPVPTAYRHPGMATKPKTAQQQQFQEQKLLLHDFSSAVRILRQQNHQPAQLKFKGTYTHNSIARDSVSEYFYATLVTEDDSMVPCVVKKIPKTALGNFESKRSLAIENLVTSYHSSDFIVKTLNHYQDGGFLYLYFDLTNFNPLNLYTTNCNPTYLAFFRSNLESHIRFVLAGVIEGLSYLHSLSIVYRGVNTQNVVILEDGYPLLTNLSRLHPEGHRVAGGEGGAFVSPEEYRGGAVTHGADLWSLGVLAYFMCTGTIPNAANFVENQFRPIGVSLELSDLVNRLMVFNPAERIGFRYIGELQSHPFFRDFNWGQFERRGMVSPFAGGQSRLERVYEERSYDQQSYSANSGFGLGFGFIATMLFVDIAAIYLISEAFDYEQSGVLHQEGNFNENAYVPEHLQDVGGYDGDWGGDGGDGGVD